MKKERKYGFILDFNAGEEVTFDDDQPGWQVAIAEKYGIESAGGGYGHMLSFKGVEKDQVKAIATKIADELKSMGIDWVHCRKRNYPRDRIF